jgi:hypothetical protein
MSNPNKPVFALVGVVAVALAIGAYFLAYSPVLAARAEAKEQAVELSQTNVAERAKLDELRQEAKNLDAMTEELASYTEQFPTGEELAGFTRYLSKLGEQTGAKVVKATRSDPVAVTVANPLPPGPEGYAAPAVPAPPAGLFEYTFTIELMGTWRDTLKYVEALQAKGARMFLVADVSVQAMVTEAAGASGLTSADDPAKYTVTGRTYALVPADQVPDLGEGGADSAEAGGGDKTGGAEDD